MDQTEINSLPSQPDLDKIDRTKNLDKSQLNILEKYRMTFPGIDDNTLCRFLKARGFNLDKAEALLKEALEWRESTKPELITFTEVEKWANVRIVIRHGQDKQGRPLLILRNDRYIPKNIDLFEFEKYVLYVLEKSISEMPPNVDTFCIISDMKEAKLSNFNLSHTRHFIPIIQDYYPERLGAAYIVNYSWIVKSIWATVKVFLNEATLQKIQFLDGKELSRLHEYFDENQLPIAYGGTASIEL